MIDTDSTVDTLWRTLGLVNGSTQFADTKGSIILFADGALASIVSSKLVDAHDILYRNYFLIGMITLGAILWFASAYFAVQCVRPRMGKGEATSLIYFGHIARRYPHDSKEYEQAVRSELSEESRIVAQLSQQVWANSKVAARKHANARMSLDFLILTVIAGMIAGGTQVLGGVL